MLLLMMWLGPVTFVQTDAPQLLALVGAPTALAESRVIPAGRALHLQPGTHLSLRLRDGSTLEGRFLGRALLDSASYVPRYTARAETSSYVPFALGETLHVSMQGGRVWTAPFAGYGELTLLLRHPEEPGYLRLAFEYAREIRRASGEQVQPEELARAFRQGWLPSAEALALENAAVGTLMERWASALRVPVEDIQNATVELENVPGVSRAPGMSSEAVVGLVILGVMASVVIVILILRAGTRPSTSGCRSASIQPHPTAISGMGLTTQPFDTYWGRFVGDSQVAADPWLATTEGDSAAALADPTALHSGR